MPTIATKRVYDRPDLSDGFRLLVMRRWPRGIAKASRRVGDWEKELGPNLDLLRRWQNDDVTWEAFAGEYLAQVLSQPTLLEWAKGLAQGSTLTLLCSCKDADHCHRALLKGVLESPPLPR